MFLAIRTHRECRLSGGCKSADGTCEWCGIHESNVALACCKQAKTYPVGHKCRGADYPAEDRNHYHCVLPNDEKSNESWLDGSGSKANF